MRDKVVAGLVAALLSALLAACAWYLREVSTEVREMRAELREATRQLERVIVIQEIQAGGDPLAPEE